MSLLVRYHTHHTELSGYGKAAKAYIDVLDNLAGVELEVAPVYGDHDFTREADVAIYHSMPNPERLGKAKRSPARKHVAMTAWETQPMPLENSQTLLEFDAVIFPSRFSAQLPKFESGRDDFHYRQICHVVPHYFDPFFWVPAPPKESEIFTFYSIGAWGERKNMLGLLEAYLCAFSKLDRVRLVLVIDKVNFQAIHSVIARSGIPPDELPGVVVPADRLTDEEILDLHRQADCFVIATRAEGFGLPIFEAMAMGKPILSPLWGGQAEFLGGYRQFWPIEYHLTPVFPGADELEIIGNQMVIKTSLPRGANCKQFWAEPHLDDLVTKMRQVLRDARAGRLRDDHSQRVAIEERFAYPLDGGKLLQVLQEICSS